MILRTVLLAATVFLLFFPPTVLLAAKGYVEGSVAESGHGMTNNFQLTVYIHASPQPSLLLGSGHHNKHRVSPNRRKCQLQWR
jgi:hypothetical protein